MTVAQFAAAFVLGAVAWAVACSVFPSKECD